MDRLRHAIFGHKFYYVFTDKDGANRTKNYKCSWCDSYFKSGVYNWLFDENGKRVR